MSEPQIIRTPSGEELVVIPRAEYEALMAAAAAADNEDAEDVAVYDARKADLAAGRDTPLPAEVSALMLRGDNLLRAVRRWRGLSQTELAERIGVSQGYLSDLESGRRTGTADTLAALSSVLGVRLA